VEKNRKQQQYHDRNSHADATPVFPGEQDTEEIVPGVPIIRSNTPRPSSFEAMLASAGHIQKPLRGGSLEMETGALPRGFPVKAPSAPPLPEELEDDVDVGEGQILGLSFADAPSRTGESRGGQGLPLSGSCPQPHRSEVPLSVPTADQTDFVWLFEYGLEMDVAILNSRERLNGQACLHGPAVLRGYTLMLGAQRIHNSSGPIIVALVPATDVQTEVWGVLYRVPRRLLESSEFEPSLLDTIHAAIAPQKFFEGIEVVVQDAYQNHEVTSVTYIATKLARQQLQLVEADRSNSDSQFMQRLVEIARQQKLPEDYIRQHLVLTATATDRIPQVHREDDESSYSSMYTSPLLSSPLPLTNPGQASLLSQREQHTDALPAFKDDLLASTQVTQRIATQARSQRWLVAFSLYLAGLVLILLLLAVVQGMGVVRDTLVGGFTPLGVPWQVLVYGLLGGCVSCIVSLCNIRASDPPLFVMITWFTRPFVGSLLAIFSYVLLTSGLFMLGESVGRHPGFFWLVGILAGLCEWWLFCRRRA
jgi:hypothetical protein